jgi:glycerol-3-phosphate dehydrogenase subunit B
MLDLLIVGAGLSGLMAAYTAASAGLRVRVVNKGLGAMHWTAGTIDVLGYAHDRQREAVRRPLEAVVKFLQEHPEHPFALLDLVQISDTLRMFVTLTEELGIPYVGADDNQENLLLPSPAGVPRPTFLAPRAQKAGDLGRKEPMLIVGFGGMSDYYPLLIAENLTKLGYQARAEMLPIELLTTRRDANSVQLAHELDDNDRRMRLGRRLKEIIQVGERIGLPAILGMDAHNEVMTDLQELCGVPVFEIPTLPPSVPGIRLFKALHDKLHGMGVRVEKGMEIITAEKKAPQNGTVGKISWMESRTTTTRPLKHRAKNFLLATGGILGSGFNSDADGRVWEVILDLPLTTPQDRSEWFDGRFLSPGGHPVYTGGVMVNKDFQPVAGDGSLLYENLWVAGHMLAGADPILERSVEGIAIVSGIAAGKAIATR